MGLELTRTLWIRWRRRVKGGAAEETAKATFRWDGNTLLVWIRRADGKATGNIGIGRSSCTVQGGPGERVELLALGMALQTSPGSGACRDARGTHVELEQRDGIATLGDPEFQWLTLDSRNAKLAMSRSQSVPSTGISQSATRIWVPVRERRFGDLVERK